MLFSSIPVKKFENSWDRMLTRQLCKKYLSSRTAEHATLLTDLTYFCLMCQVCEKCHTVCCRCSKWKRWTYLVMSRSATDTKFYFPLKILNSRVCYLFVNVLWHIIYPLDENQIFKTGPEQNSLRATSGPCAVICPPLHQNLPTFIPIFWS